MGTVYHQSVFLKEVIGFLKVAPGKKYIDATLGGGGHSAAIREHGGYVLGIDYDPRTVALTKINLAAKLKIKDEKLKIVEGNFKDIDEIAKKNGFEKVDGILFDLGMSSWQLEHSGRGFSFRKDEPLDMRFNPAQQKVAAADLINCLSKKELYELFFQFGQEVLAKKFADFIVRERRIKAIRTTADLVAVIQKATRGERGRLHPATKVFLALRLAVNDELENLRIALLKAWELLSTDGRLAVISFQSLEDRIVKREFLRLNKKGILTKKPLRPSHSEILRNPRARSAKLRVLEKI